MGEVPDILRFAFFGDREVVLGKVWEQGALLSRTEHRMLTTSTLTLMVGISWGCCASASPSPVTARAQLRCISLQ